MNYVGTAFKKARKMSWASQMLKDTAGQAAGGLVGGIMGLALGGINDRRQIKQQQKLTNMQVKANQSMLDYQKVKDLEMWKATGPVGQMEQYKEAGLNPGLMYGMGGGGGQTVGGSSGGIGGGQAPSGGGEALAMMGMGLQMKMMKAQIANIEADTKKKLEGDLPNTQADTVLKEWESKLKDLEYKYEGRSLVQRLNLLDEMVGKMKGEARSAVAYGNNAQEMSNEQLRLVKQEISNKIAEAIYTNQKTTESKAQVVKMSEEIKLILENTQYVKENTYRVRKENAWIDITKEELINQIRKGLDLQSRGIDVQEQGQVINTILNGIGIGLLKR